MKAPFKPRPQPLKNEAPRTNIRSFSIRANVRGAESPEALAKGGKKTIPRHKSPHVAEVSAGGIVVKKGPQGFVFALMKDSYDKWSFPKGRVEKGEELADAAARETMEELGLERIHLVEYLGKIDIWFKDRFEKKGALVHKDIHYFLFEAPEDAEIHPVPSEHTYETRWVLASEVLDQSSYRDVWPIIHLALEKVKKWER